MDDNLDDIERSSGFRANWRDLHGQSLLVNRGPRRAACPSKKVTAHLLALKRKYPISSR
jgi:hypothetical protein